MSKLFFALLALTVTSCQFGPNYYEIPESNWVLVEETPQ